MAAEYHIWTAPQQEPVSMPGGRFERPGRDCPASAFEGFYEVKEK